MLKSLTVHGLRGFGEKCTIEFATPNNNEGSGLTVLVGGNNSGKTTILEALRSFNSTKDNPPSFSERKRNIKCENGKIHLCLQTTDNEQYRIDTIDMGGSMTTYTKEGVDDDICWDSPKIFVLQSRRYFDYEFSRNNLNRDDYIRNQQFGVNNRSAYISEFNSRLFKMQKKNII